MVLVYMLTFIGGILMGSMLPYIAGPWIRHGYLQTSQKKQKNRFHDIPC